MNIFDNEIDLDLVNKGFVADLGKHGRWTLAYAGQENKAYKKAIEAALRPHRVAIDNKLMDDDVLVEIIQRTWFGNVVKLWEGVDGADGPLPFTADNMIEIFHRVPQVWQALQKIALEVNNFTRAVREAAVGNLPSV